MRRMCALVMITLACFAIPALDAQQPPKSPQNALQSGLLAEIYHADASIDDFPTIAPEKKPTLRRIDAQVNVGKTKDQWPGTEFKDHLFIRWTGLIRIQKPGTYKFFTESDDGSRLFIGETQVVDNGGAHPMAEKEGQIDLQPGDHPIRLEYVENEGDCGCKLLWQPPGGQKQIIPATALFHPTPKP